FGNGLTSFLANPEVEFEEDGQYLITHIAYNDCGTDTLSEWITISTVSLETLEMLSMQIRPNPFREEVQIVLHANGVFALTVFDILGQIVHSEMIRVAGKTEIIQNLRQCTPGTYFIRIAGEGTFLSGKLIKL